MKKYFAFTLFALIAVAVVACNFKKTTSKQDIICDKTYALCTSAHCIPNPNQPNEAICFCDVHEGKSLGRTACTKRDPYIDHMGVKRVISTFSFEQFSSKKCMTCPSGTPWTDCLDQPCTVDPLDSSKAICACKVIRTGAYQTFGGNCDTSTCDGGFWSGATVEGNEASTKSLMQALDLREPPTSFCSE